ncbi:TPA: hypothetical protein U2D39_000359 [Streptococcus suis]|nr:hypothetical protein [Streptococcus suis]
MSDKTKLQWINGSIIKQGDTSSIFKLKLRTEDRRKLNGPAKIQLIHQTKGVVEFEAEVVDDVVSFRLEKALPIGNYIVEVEHAGYVFPSTNSVVFADRENTGVLTRQVEIAAGGTVYIKGLAFSGSGSFYAQINFIV